MSFRSIEKRIEHDETMKEAFAASLLCHLNSRAAINNTFFVTRLHTALSVPRIIPKRRSHIVTTATVSTSSSSSSPDTDTEWRVGHKRSGSTIRSQVFVVGDNIDTDQIIPAEYLTLVPSRAEEYRKLGSYALCGLAGAETPYVPEGKQTTPYGIIIGGKNFGCGSSREHAPIAMGAAGGRAVIAESYARIFFRNCSSTGELYPWECKERLCDGDKFRTGEEAEIDFDKNVVRNLSRGGQWELQELGDVGPVVDAGGIFEYARRQGMIAL